MFEMLKNKRRNALPFTRSEGIFSVKSSLGAEHKKSLTGYRTVDSSRRIDEALRFENSYGNISFGRDRKKQLTILVSEKRRHNSGNIGEKEKQLFQSRQTERPMGRGRTIYNPGGREEGAFAFQYHPGVSRFEMMERMKQYLSSHNQTTLEQMMSFMTTREDMERRRLLEPARREAVEKGDRPGARLLARRQEEEERLLTGKRQMENRFNLKLVQAMREAREAEGFDQGALPLQTAFARALLKDGIPIQPGRPPGEDETDAPEGVLPEDGEAEGVLP